MLRSSQTLFTYLHLAADREQAQALLASGATAIAYETVTAPDGSLPLLTPMSEVAGRMSVQVGANCLQKANGGFGVLLGGVPGVAPAKVVVLGGGVSGTHAVEMAVGLRADVTVVDRSVKRLRELSSHFRQPAEDRVLDRACHRRTGARRRPRHRRGADSRGRGTQAGYPRHGQDHEAGRGAGRYRNRSGRLLRDQPSHDACRTDLCAGRRHPLRVTNMPGAVPRTSTFALTNATLPYVKALADHGWRAAISKDPGLAQGLNVHAGQLTHEAVASALGLDYRAYRAA